MRFAWKAILLAVFGCLVGCVSRVPSQLPDTDIVFQNMAGNTGNPNTFGFINSDGSGLTIVELGRSRGAAVHPTWSADGQTLVFFDTEYGGSDGDLGLLTSARIGGFVNRCSSSDAFGSEPISISADGKRALIESTRGLHWIDLDTCALDESFDMESVRGLDLSPAGERIVMGGDGGIFIANLHNLSQRKQLATEGIKPRWSPDGQWIAYVAFDGIYTIKADGTGRRRVVSYNVRRLQIGTDVEYEEWAPAPTWSPDGKWLVYHKCVRPRPEKGLRCEPNEIDQYAIFKVEIATGTEIKLLDGGLNPYWRQRK